MRPGFSFLVCSDSALLREELERQIISHPPACGEWKRQVFWGDEEPGPNFWNSLSQTGLFQDCKAIIVRQAESWPASTWKDISTALGREMSHVWPFFCLEVGVEKGKYKIPAHIQKLRCFSFAEKKRWLWRSEGLGSRLQAFVRDHAQKHGLTFQGDTFSRFCETVTPDARSIINELEKLSLLSKDGKVTPDMMIREGARQESDSFALIKKITAGDLYGAWQEASQDNDGSLLFFAVAVLAREFRTLWQISAGSEPRMYPAEAGRKRALARNLGPEGISKGMAALADAEWQVKSGRQTPAQTLEKLCVDMCALFRS